MKNCPGPEDYCNLLSLLWIQMQFNFRSDWVKKAIFEGLLVGFSLHFSKIIYSYVCWVGGGGGPIGTINVSVQI